MGVSTKGSHDLPFLYTYLTKWAKKKPADAGFYHLKFNGCTNANAIFASGMITIKVMVVDIKVNVCY